MKALSMYSKEKINFIKLMKSIENYGSLNCSFEKFCTLYDEWHNYTFPSQPVTIETANVRRDWFICLVNFLANKDI